MMKRASDIFGIGCSSSKDGRGQHSFRARRVCLFVAVLLASTAAAQYGGGTGKPNDPYLIYTAEQMNAIGAEPNDWDKCFKLMADIDLRDYSGEQFRIIGTLFTPFMGVFDGDGHTVSNFTYRCTGKDYVGLFARVGRFNAPAIIKNVRLTDPNIDAGTGSYVGALVGFMRDATIADCRVLGGRVSGGDDTGGLIGGTVAASVLSYSPEMHVYRCHATTQVVGLEHVGGLIGYFEWAAGGPFDPLLECSRISGCHASGEVLGQADVGGLAGIAKCVDIIDCYSQASISGDRRVGGLLGSGWGAMIVSCYAAGRVAGASDVGGLVGQASAAPADNSYWDVWTSGQTTSACGVGRTTAQMQQRATFANWDFDGIWDIAENQTYPFLRQSVAANDVPAVPSEE